MNKVQCNPIGKLLAWALLVVFAFTGAWFGLSALTAAPFLGTDGWQDNQFFRSVIRDYQYQLTDYFADQMALGGEELSYVQRQQLEDDVQAFEQAFAPAATPFRYQIRSADGSQVLFTNLSEEETLSQAVSKVYYAVFQEGESTQAEDEFWDWNYSISGYTLHTNSNGSIYGFRTDPSFIIDTEAGLDYSDGQVAADPFPAYVIECGAPADPLLAAPESTGEFTQLFLHASAARTNLSSWTAAALAFLAAALVCLGYALWTAGHRAGGEAIALTWQEKIFFDLYLLVMMCVGAALFAGALTLGEQLYFNTVYPSQLDQQSFTLLQGGVAGMCALFVGAVGLTLRTCAVRCKAGTLAQTTLLCRALSWCWRMVQKLAWLSRAFVSSLPITWRIIAAFLVYFSAGVFLFNGARYSPLAAMLWLLLQIGVLLFLCWWTACFRRLRQGSQAIAAGNLNHQIDTHRMPHDLRLHAEDLNNISAGMSSAVDEKMKSERFKAELITNVSHDLKTPLTSILNYVNLLKTTQQTDPKAQEYIEVLDRKSQRLKKLTEDLVEASKASTGVLSVNREKIGMAQLMDQALGEWAEKLADRKLTVVTTLPEGETWVYADGRHLWRVIDNLLSNCAKYAMEGTRVYMDLVRGHGQVTLSVKNISRDALNVPSERLMERFVRGDESRATEGSGLGLSIARSLTELQGGTFALTVDGDLFKATVTLPQAN